MSDFTHGPFIECRSEGRRLIGTALHFGELSPGHRERFVPGSIDLDDRLRWLNLDHDRNLVLAHTGSRLRLSVDEKGVHLEADLSPRLPLLDRAMASVRQGERTGLSVEFVPHEQRREGGITVVEKAALFGIGLVSNPSYKGSRVEARQRPLTGKIPYVRRMYCECQDGQCQDALFEKGAFESYIEGGDQQAAEILATAGGFDSAFASLSRGTLRIYDDDEGLRVVIANEALQTRTGKRILELMKAVPVRMRPLIDNPASTAKKQVIDGVETNVYRKVALRGFLFRPVAGDRADEWPEVELGDEKPPERRVELPRRRRPRIWL